MTFNEKELLKTKLEIDYIKNFCIKLGAIYESDDWSSLKLVKKDYENELLKLYQKQDTLRIIVKTYHNSTNRNKKS